MDNPFGPPVKKKGQGPPPKNTFQQELQARMYQRKKAGLATDVTPSESGQSEDELGSDNELMAGFNISSKNKSPGRKSPYNELNGYGGHKQSNTEVIFGKKHGSHYEDDYGDLGDAPSDLLMTRKTPIVMPGKGGKKQPQRQKSPLALKEEDEVDADMSNVPRYMKQEHKKPWQPPTFQKSSLQDMDYDHEQLKLDLHKTKHRPKSPKPGRKTPSDLGSITEEREMDFDMDDDMSPKLGSGRQFGSEKAQKPMPKPRETKSGKPGTKASPSAELKNKGRAPSPTTDIFGKNRPKSPFAKDSLEKEDLKSFLKNKDKEKEKKEKEKKEKPKSPSILDMMAGGPSKSAKPGLKDSKGKKQDKGKHLTYDDDSDDSIGGEFKRKDEVPRKKQHGKDHPLGRYSPGKQQGSSYDRERGDKFSPFDPRNRQSPLDQGGRKSPLDVTSSGKHAYGKQENPFDRRGSPLDRKSPYEDYGRGDERRSPLSVLDDKKRQGLYSPKDKRLQGDPSKKGERDKSPSQKEKNPFSRDRADDLRRSGERDIDDRYNDRDQYGDRDHRYGDRDHTDFRNLYGEPDRDKLGRKSPFSRDLEENRKTPYERGDDRRGFDDMDRGFGHDRHVAFKQDLGKPTLKGKYDKSNRNPFDRDRDEYRDRKPTLRKDERDEYDRYSRQKFGESKERGRSHSRGRKDEERDSSLCRDVDEDPSSMKKPPTEEEEKMKKHKVKSHTKEHALLDQVIESVKEEQTKFKPVDPDKSKEKTEEKQRSQSARHRPKPRYAKPVVESFPSRPKTDIDLNNTHSIRDAVFLDWYKDRQQKARKAKEEKDKKEKEEEEKKKKEEEDKKIESLASYNAWTEKKKEELLEKQKQKHKEQRKKDKEVEEKQDREGQSQKSFNLWKDDKDAELKSKVRQKKREERQKIEEEEEKKYQKQKDAKSAFKTWNEKKIVVIQEKEYAKRQEAAKKKREERRQKDHQEKEAVKSYDKWLQKKAKADRENMKSMKTRRLEEMTDTRPAWSPASRTVPFGK